MYFLLAIIFVLATFLAVVGMVNQWVKYKTWRDDRYIVQQIYTRHRLIWLYTKCWIIVVAVLTLIIWVDMDALMMVLVVLLGLLSLMGVVYGENLAEISLLQSQGENQMLRSQLNPHFLYNTLNNIDALIWLDQERASAAVTNLSQLMRYFTYSARQERVALGEEIVHLSELIELQRLRMPTKGSLTFVTHIEHPKATIAPLLLLPLIENCFKHCGDLNEPDAICIEIRERDGQLDYRSTNNIKRNPSSEISISNHPHGLGMTVLRRRLDLLYPEAYQLDTDLEEDRFLTHLEVLL